MSGAEVASRPDGLLPWFSVVPLDCTEQPVPRVGSIGRLWHAFSLHSELCRRFCDRYFGRCLDHDPRDRLGEETAKRACARFILALQRESSGDAATGAVPAGASAA